MINYVNENLTAFVQNVDSNIHKVVLYSRTSRGEICINSQLLSLGHATTSDPSKCIFNKRNIRESTINNLPINSRVVSSTYVKIIVIMLCISVINKI